MKSGNKRLKGATKGSTKMSTRPLNKKEKILQKVDTVENSGKGAVIMTVLFFALLLFIVFCGNEVIRILNSDDPKDQCTGPNCPAPTTTTGAPTEKKKNLLTCPKCNTVYISYKKSVPCKCGGTAR